VTGPRTEDEQTLVVDGGSVGGDSTTRATRGAAPTMLVEGTMVGRYVVLERLGEGGMGVVARAYDPKLRREVALKVMRASTGFGRPEAKARMLREAQALARLSDPHVVAVYDAEITEHGVCIAMEYVEGRTLRAWLREQARQWPEVLDVVLAAARGLAAAHAAGIVHRDVKPANVLVGEDGRVRLTDFGLACEREDAPSVPRLPSREEEEAERDDLSGVGDGGAHDGGPDSLSRLTQLGTVLGTPAYMAPEQDDGENADAQSDQYSLCVVLWEALYGRRPFLGANAQALLHAKRRGPPPRRSSSVPEWVHAIVARGLTVDPEKRWPSIDALVHALASGRERARRRRAFVGLGVAACVVLGGVSWQRWDRARDVAACEREGESIAEIWNQEVREELRTTLVEAGVSYAEEMADKVMPWIDAQATAWQIARTESCADARVYGTWDADLLDRGLWCLDERWMELEALVTELAHAEASGLQKAVQAAAELGQVAACRNVDLLQRTPRPPKAGREEVRSVRAELSRATALRRTGAYDEGLAVAREALARAEPLEWSPLAAEARLGLGRFLERTGDYAEAEAALEAAYFEAIEVGALEIAVDAAGLLVFTVGSQLARHEDGLRWSRHAAVTLASLPDIAQLRRASHLHQLATLHGSKGSYEEAKALHERALALREQALGSEHPAVLTSLASLAGVHWSAGSYEEAKAMYERASTLWENMLGPEHPDIATSLVGLANVHYTTGSYEEAKRHYERALAIREDALGPEHPDVSVSIK
jgi:eukaryotic-like serine/threonine-protein kinase